MKAPLLLSLIALSGCTVNATPNGHGSCMGTVTMLEGGAKMLDLTSDPFCVTNRAFGYAIGKQFAAEIFNRIDQGGPQLMKILEYIFTERGLEASDQLMDTTKAKYPEYWEEVQGIAEGSDIPIFVIASLNFREELFILANNGTSGAGYNDCSDSMLSFDTALLGHNEDNTADTVNTTYFVRANSLNGRSWTAYTYAGELSSAAWGFNDAGVAFTLNAVYADEVRPNGVGRNFVSRSVLDAPDLDSAIARVTVPNQATGHNINLIGLDDQQIVTIETGPGNVSSVKRLREESYFHANAYKRLDVPQTPGPSSKHREARAAELKKPKTRGDILNILGDTKDKDYPIWRAGSDGEYTLCTALFDLKAENVEIFFDNPKRSLNLTQDSQSISFRLRQNPCIAYYGCSCFMKFRGRN